MPECFSVLQIGFGSLGRHIAEAILNRDNLQLIALIDADPSLLGRSVNEFLSKPTESSVTIQGDLEKALSILGKNPPDVAVVATASSLETVFPTITSCLKHGMDVISICEQLSYPYKKQPGLSSELHRIATEAGKAVLGTGINPGYLMDLLPIVLTAPCQSVDSIHVTRHMNSSRRRPSFQKKIGTGMAKEEFRKKIDEGQITGHVGLVESIQMIEKALQLHLEEIKELPPEAVIAKKTITNSFTTIKKGDVLGLKSTGVGVRAGKEIVRLDFLAYAEAAPEYDEVVIEGHPSIHQRIEGGVQGDQGTIGMIINLIPLMSNLSPGLKTMIDIPVPRNTMRYYRK
ncbi:MAG: dihydrodipicolinate reductase [Candidatus Thorarchaeota archaeon]